jgi:hypothetical protein
MRCVKFPAGAEAQPSYWGFYGTTEVVPLHTSTCCLVISEGRPLHTSPEEHPSGAKAPFSSAVSVARLKSCSFKAKAQVREGRG